MVVEHYAKMYHSRFIPKKRTASFRFLFYYNTILLMNELRFITCFTINSWEKTICLQEMQKPRLFGIGIHKNTTTEIFLSWVHPLKLRLDPTARTRPFSQRPHVPLFFSLTRGKTQVVRRQLPRPVRHTKNGRPITFLFPSNFSPSSSVFFFLPSGRHMASTCWWPLPLGRAVASF